MQSSPKDIERGKRDATSLVDPSHCCTQIECHSTDWRCQLLNCRKCKRELCNFLCDEMLVLAPQFLSNNQTLFNAGGFLGNKRHQCWCIQKDGQSQPLPIFRSNAEETDLSIWLNCVRSSGTRKMLYSPDTNVYHIGMTLISQCEPQPDVYIELHMAVPRGVTDIYTHKSFYKPFEMILI